jgi:hypothetical protein
MHANSNSFSGKWLIIYIDSSITSYHQNIMLWKSAVVIYNQYHYYILGKVKCTSSAYIEGPVTKLDATVHDPQPIIIYLDGKPFMKMVQQQTLRASDALI